MDIAAVPMTLPSKNGAIDLRVVPALHAVR